MLGVPDGVDHLLGCFDVVLGNDEHIVGEVGGVAVLLAAIHLFDPLQDLLVGIADKEVAEAFEV
jgi:hypothetical protein